MNEPALFVPRQSTMPDDVVHPGGSTGEAKWHAQIHNTYGSLVARAAREGLLKLKPDTRPFVITRAGYAGLQRHAMQWTGDNSSWWEHLWMGMPQLQNLGLSGIAWAGVDVGGFWGDTTGELLARWTEFGVFQPFCRNHSALGTRSQEPWAFGEPYESVCRGMIRLRQRLLPYLYTLFEECHRTGAPILRPLLFEYPADETTYTADDEFLLGKALLIAPISRPGIEHRHVYLPEGPGSTSGPANGSTGQRTTRPRPPRPARRLPRGERPAPDGARRRPRRRERDRPPDRARASATGAAPGLRPSTRTPARLRPRERRLRPRVVSCEARGHANRPLRGTRGLVRTAKGDDLWSCARGVAGQRLVTARPGSRRPNGVSCDPARDGAATT
jgi:hypothetical protein